ncbi:DnaJ domain-containing protein [Cladochytrium replicatum]|nr:DnaJ domain-containing protein [Cladochytrium replicatum]
MKPLLGQLRTFASGPGRASWANERSPYDVLQVPKDASPRQIKSNYYRLSMKYHPDRIANSNHNPLQRKKLHDAFCQIQNAYEVLSDTERRVLFDHSARERATGAPRRASREYRGEYYRYHEHRHYQKPDTAPLFKFIPSDFLVFAAAASPVIYLMYTRSGQWEKMNEFAWAEWRYRMKQVGLHGVVGKKE